MATRPQRQHAEAIRLAAMDSAPHPYGRGYVIQWEGDLITLDHYGTRILTVDTAGDDPRVVDVGGWSCSDRDAVNSFADLLGLDVSMAIRNGAFLVSTH